ncbi:Pimeloyl-[acyl-carrier protein] methyl ester esterase [Microbacterium lemovicicum]|uniref:Pimeloyl-[acyl-carrier protein] methyl ester esterase n=1 Tax=Microbacterium lemovicicum TaxID=1072463 RepID=A0A3S9W6P0_9MICO|nr:alpha/beta hydrolase [Microbacterium lemovicicum]AZS35741.1 Pimeloyl-[acyl-carrier protein] methyl ester esterase [Microbacterium lemovicicum]
MTNAAVWFSVSGDGEPLVALHPGGTDSRAMEPLLAELADYRRILIDRPGHGRSADSAGPWCFEDMADVIAGVLEELGVDSAHVVGWSDGAIVGLQLALRRPELVRSLVFGAGVFHHEGWRDGVLGGEPPDFMSDAYAEVSPDGRDHWRVVVAKSAALHAVAPTVSTTDLAHLVMPVLVVAGDDDEVRIEHLIEMFEALPDGELAILPRATHGALIEKPDLLARLIRDLHHPAGNGLAPIRRE